jgi:hypothetical protein
MMKVFTKEEGAKNAGNLWKGKAFPQETRLFEVHPAFLFVHNMNGKVISLYVVKTEVRHWHSSYGQSSERIERDYL